MRYKRAKALYGSPFPEGDELDAVRIMLRRAHVKAEDIAALERHAFDRDTTREQVMASLAKADQLKIERIIASLSNLPMYKTQTPHEHESS